MKTYVVQSGFETNFYPPLTKDQLSALYEENVFRPVRAQAEKLGKELVIKEELNIVGRIIIEASEDAAKILRQLGFKLQLKKAR
jgi:hypothetical protein